MTKKDEVVFLDNMVVSVQHETPQDITPPKTTTKPSSTPYVMDVESDNLILPSIISEVESSSISANYEPNTVGRGMRGIYVYEAS